jgi:hypothetical protein
MGGHSLSVLLRIGNTQLLSDSHPKDRTANEAVTEAQKNLNTSNRRLSQSGAAMRASAH